MSKPIQNTFTLSPDTNSNLTNQVTNLENKVGFGQTINSTTALPAINETLQSFAYGNQSLGPLFGQGQNDAPHKGAFFYGGNVRTGQTIFASTGICNSKGEAWTLDTVYNWASSGKMLLGLVTTKMIEEGLIKSSTKLSEIDPVLYSGNAVYYTNVIINTGAEIGFPINPASYSASTGIYDLSQLTVGDMIQFKLALPDDAFILPAVGAFSLSTQFSTGPTSLLGALGIDKATTADKASMIILNTYIQSLLTQGTGCIGFSGRVFNGLPFNPETLINDIATSYINNVKSGVTPLFFKPGEFQYPSLPYAVRAVNASYDISYAVLAIILDQRLRQLYALNPISYPYPNFSAYTRQKFLDPLGMSKSFITYQDSIPSSNSIAENSWRRSIIFGAIPVELDGTTPFSPTGTDPTTWAAYGCDPSYITPALVDYGTYFTSAGTGGSIAGPLVWTSEYPNDGMSRFTKSIYCVTGSPTGYTSGIQPLMSSIRDFGKLLQFVANKGSSPSGTQLLKTQSWNYFISGKVNVFSGFYTNNFQSEGVNIVRNSSFAMGLQRVNRDLENIPDYGFDESTLWYNGFTGNIYMVDFYTGNWFVAGVPEFFSSTGDFVFLNEYYKLVSQGIGLPVKASQIGSNVTEYSKYSEFLLSLIQ
jgi:hypothetical protein